MLAPRSACRSVAPRSTSWVRSSGVCGRNSNSAHRDSSAELISKYGFSVVAPISVIRPDSTTGSSTSCWALLKRWISSRNRIVRRPCPPSRSRARPITAVTSALPTCTADSSSKSLPVAWAMMRASVVLPVPGAPWKMADGTRSSSIARRSAVPGPIRCAWPTNPSSPSGRTRSASGADACSASAAALSKRSAMRGSSQARATVSAWQMSPSDSGAWPSAMACSSTAPRTGRPPSGHPTAISASPRGARPCAPASPRACRSRAASCASPR